ncbi:MAG: tetratricopeptide repeat protein [Candidatus Eisenbacteria bacterium]
MSLETSGKKSVMDDPGAELLDQAQGIWSRYGQTVLIALLVVVAAGVGTYYWKSGQARQENSASEKLAEANDLFWRADYERSRTIAKDVAKQFGGTPSGTDALRIAGDDAYWRGNWKDAIADYQEYLKKNGSGLVADAVRRSLGYALESDGKFAEAATHYDKLVGVFDRESSGEMLFASARCMVAAGKPDQAKQRYQRILDEFPDSSFQLQARIELGRLSPTTIN